MTGRHWSEETRWEPIAEVVERLKARVDASIAARDDAGGDAAHADLIAAEHRLRMAERRRAG